MNVFRRVLDLVRRNFGGHDVSGGSGRWPASSVLWAPVSQQLASRNIAVKRIGWLVENSPTAASIVNAYLTAICGGDSFTARSSHPDPDVAADLEKRFASFAKACDIEGISDLAGLATRVARSLIVGGEAFVHQVVVENGQLKLRLLAVEQVDANITRPSLGLTGDKPAIVAGVEVDHLGRRIAFWVLPTQPDAPWASVALAVRIPALDICHVFEARHAGSVRGYPWLAPAATRLIELDGVEDACIAKAKVSALFAGFVRDLDGSSGMGNEASKTDPASLGLEPGTVRVLPAGCDIVFPNLPDMNSISDVLRHMVRSCAAGSGVPYELASADFSQTNYSSGRQSAEVFRRRVKHIQQSMICAQFLEPVWRRFVLLEILSGRLRADDYEAAPENYMNCEFRFSQPEPIDPLKQAKSDVLLLNAKIKSRAQLVAEGGRDVSDINREIEADPSAPDLTADAASIQAQPEEVANAN